MPQRTHGERLDVESTGFGAIFIDTKSGDPMKLISAIVFLAVVASGSVTAAEDPTIDQIYQAAGSGQIEQAIVMIKQVLAHHPNSAKAHYVAAEIFVKTCARRLAQDELDEAVKLDPDLKFVTPRSLKELKAALRTPVPPRCDEAR